MKRRHAWLPKKDGKHYKRIHRRKVWFALYRDNGGEFHIGNIGDLGFSYSNEMLKIVREEAPETLPIYLRPGVFDEVDQFLTENE